MLWAAILERYLSEDLQGAATALAIAQEQNPHVAEHLARREAPDSVPTEDYEPGDENEALHCTYTVGMAWMRYPEASKWLAGRISA
jgi:hypothetical protein